MKEAGNMKRLNIGCGNDIREGWINLDSVDLEGVDVCHDINKLPLPFEDSSLDEVDCQDVLEHCTDYIAIVEDIHRILKRGGKLKIRVPHFTSKNAYTDPTHKVFFAFRTFHFFSKKSIKARSYYFDFSFDPVQTEITFEGSMKIFFFNKLVKYLVNRNDRSRYIYESTFLSRLFPAENIVVTLTK